MPTLGDLLAELNQGFASLLHGIKELVQALLVTQSHDQPSSNQVIDKHSHHPILQYLYTLHSREAGDSYVPLDALLSLESK